MTSPRTGGCPIAANSRPSNRPTMTTAVSAISRCSRTSSVTGVPGPVLEIMRPGTDVAGAESVSP